MPVAAPVSMEPEKATTGRHILLAFGTSSYHGIRKDLPEVIDELEIVAEAFGRYGYTRRMPSKKESVDLPSTALLEAIQDGVTDTTSEDIVTVYYSGHGEIKNAGRSLTLLTSGVRSGGTANTSIDASQLVSALIESCACKQMLIILDVCHASAAGLSFAREFHEH